MGAYFLTIYTSIGQEGVDIIAIKFSFNTVTIDLYHDITRKYTQPVIGSIIDYMAFVLFKVTQMMKIFIFMKLIKDNFYTYGIFWDTFFVKS